MGATTGLVVVRAGRVAAVSPPHRPGPRPGFVVGHSAKATFRTATLPSAQVHEQPRAHSIDEAGDAGVMAD